MTHNRCGARPIQIVKNNVFVQINGQKFVARNADKPYSLTKCEGSGRWVFEVRPGDKWIGEAAERSEVAGYNLYTGVVWLSFAFKLSSAIAPATSPGVVLGQFHATEDAGDASSGPVLAWELKGTTYKMVTRSAAVNPHLANPKPVLRWSRPDFLRGRWYRNVVRAEFHPTAGKLKSWHNGKLVFDATIPMGYVDARGPYWKMGYYDWSELNGGGIVEWANLEVGSADLTARIAAPLPIPSM